MLPANRLAFPVVALLGVGHMPVGNQSEKDEARLFYVGATQAETVQQRLVSPLPAKEAWQARAISPRAAFPCDDRQHCSHISSCEEAKFF